MEYTVESLLDKKILKGRLFYLVKWQGYPKEQSTWEPLEHLNQVLQMVSDFEAHLSEQFDVYLRIRETRVDKRKGTIKFLCEIKGKQSRWVEFYDVKESNPQLVCESLLAYISKQKQ